MSVSGSFNPLESQLWPQGDIRDPLGIWGARGSLTGDASGGSIKATLEVPAARRSAYVYTLYSCAIDQIDSATVVIQNWKRRILTNWPNTDTQAGVNAYSIATFLQLNGSQLMSAPAGFPSGISNHLPVVDNIERFILLYDPRQGITVPMPILELEINGNQDTLVYAFSAYGYYWDRSVMEAPGGPRHPGAS